MRNCDLEFKLEEILPKFDAAFQKKILHSVDLIRKAEKLALAYDPVDGYFNTFSGGKDSQCLYHIVKMAGVRFKTHMNLTSIDPPEVIRFVRTEYPDVVLQKPKDSIFNLAVKGGQLPTKRIRWCCAEYKETAGAGKVTLIGIRHSESVKRARRKEVEISNKKYSGDLEGLAEYRKQRNAKRKPRKGTFSIINVTGEREIGCIHGKESLLISPIIDWTESDVWRFLNTLGIKHCCLYDEGWKRIGCICCPMSTVVHKREEEKRWPHVKRGWIRAIKKIREKAMSSPGAAVRWLKDDAQFTPPEKPLTAAQQAFYNAGNWGGVKTEDEIAENIYDWWTSGNSYKKWYAEKFLSPDLFEEEKNDTDKRD